MFWNRAFVGGLLAVLLALVMEPGACGAGRLTARHRTTGTHRTPATVGKKAPPPVREITPDAGMVITRSARFKPGEYSLPGGTGGAIRITGKDIAIDASAARLLGDGGAVGLRISHAENVVIRGLQVSGYHWGVVVEDSTGVVLQGCTASHNGDLPAGTVIDESGRQPQDQSGGGFLFRGCQHSRVLGCIAQYEWDGLDVVRCRDNTFRDNDFSYLNNWGLHLWASTHNSYTGNRSVWCTTGEGRLYQSTSGWSTMDSAAVLIEHDSSYNLVEGNDLRYGGDGVFIRANEGAAHTGQPVPPVHPSNHNLIRNNDCSFSPNNAIEADFCDDNSFIRNNCSMSNYGFWLGYSRRVDVRENTVVGCSTRGLEIENGQDGIIAHNTFINPAGRPDQSLVLLRQNGHDNTPSGPYRILANVFSGSSHPVELVKTPVTAGGNQLLSASTKIFFGDQDSAVTTKEPDASIGPNRPAIQTLSPDPLPVGGAGAARPAAPPDGDAAAAPQEKFILPPQTNLLTIEGDRLVQGDRLHEGPGMPVVQIGGAVATVLTSTPTRLQVAVPYDFWSQLVPETTTVRVFNGNGFSAVSRVGLTWRSRRPRLSSILPMPVAPGTAVTVSGEHFMSAGGGAPEVMVNGTPVKVLTATPTALTFAAPSGLLSTRRYNLIVHANGESSPVILTVQVPKEWEPHIISGTFSPQTLSVGSLLHVKVVVKNNAPFTLPAAEPGNGHVYDERESFGSQHIEEKAGFVYVRVTSDLIGGSWPYLWGLPQPLPPGETETVEGDIRVRTAGATRYRLGLVDGRYRWIDDGIDNTPITVTNP